MGVVFYCEEGIEPEDEVEVSFELSVVRDLNDTEVIYVTHASDSFTLQLQVDSKRIRDYGVFPIHESDALCIQNARDSGYGEWKISDTILPYQGLALWWRSSERSSQAQQKSPSV